MPHFVQVRGMGVEWWGWEENWEGCHCSWKLILREPVRKLWFSCGQFFWNLQIHYSTTFRSLAPNITQFWQWMWKICM